LDSWTKRVTFSRDVAIKEGFFYSDKDNDFILKDIASNDSNVESIKPKNDSIYKKIADLAINKLIP
jgi:hypothetical protein